MTFIGNRFFFFFCNRAASYTDTATPHITDYTQCVPLLFRCGACGHNSWFVGSKQKAKKREKKMQKKRREKIDAENVFPFDITNGRNRHHRNVPTTHRSMCGFSSFTLSDRQWVCVYIYGSTVSTYYYSINLLFYPTTNHFTTPLLNTCCLYGHD